MPRLSRASLAYGKRMAARHGIENITFLNGDILDLPKLGRIFDHAECVGVLHHMADPRAGLLAISAALLPAPSCASASTVRTRARSW